MIPELGHYALCLALCLAIVQVILALKGAINKNSSYLTLAHFTAVGQFIFVGFSFSALAYVLLTNDFSVAYVAQNSNSHLPAIYRFCALWGAHEGSLLLWVFILSSWMLIVSRFSRRIPPDMVAQFLAVLAIVAIGFYLFLLTTSSPFVRLLPEFPREGLGLNPILQDPGLAVHPPILYTGYVGFAVPFAFAIVALLNGRMDVTWARWARPWTIAAWCFLTIGIVLGSAWAYRELGWGGWWFWDPVENASFLPWLAGTALIHSLAVTEKRQIFKAWTVLLAVCAFSLSLLGTFLVRSGVVVSVHSFASDPQRGLFMLSFLLLVIGSSLAIYAWRGRHLVESGSFTLWSRETLLLSNNILLFVALLTVLLGTLYPLIMDALHLGKLSVGAPYFNMVFVPLMIPVMLLMAIAPLFRWQTHSWLSVQRKLWVYLVLVLLLALLLPLSIGAQLTVGTFLSLAVVLWLLLFTLSHGLQQPYGWVVPWKVKQSQWAMILAHLGVGITALGILCTTTYSQQRDVSLRVGDSLVVGPYQFQLAEISKITGPNYYGQRAQVIVSHLTHSQQIKYLTTLYPEQRFFPVANTVTTKAAISGGIFRDLYVALGSNLPDGAWGMRIYYKPFIRWIWAGGVFMAIGGFLAVLDKRYRYRSSGKSEDTHES